MIDATQCDRKFPYRWRSSVAVFSYQPPDDQQTFEGHTVSYIKVACTITGFQPNPDEVGIKNRKLHSYWNDPAVIDNYTQVVSQYYGCYGAILEVGVSPSNRDTPVAQYPYFADFEPKKRELYEAVTDTGEVMSRSLENVNVRKGSTTSDSHEVVDIFGGASLGVNVGAVGVKGAVQGQWGTRDVSQEEFTNLRTTDQGRELRETFSHTTQLSQMYHQFTSYHLGTNRAVFFMLPRPHIVQTDLTFVNGPRLLEGIQEILLVVVRPRDVRDICVEAYLETAHIASEPIFAYETSTGTFTLHLEKKAVEVDLDGVDDSQDQPAETSETYVPPDGWEVDLERDGGYKIESTSGERITEAKVSEAARDHVTAFGKVTARFQDDTWPDDNEFLDGRLDMVVTVYIRKKAPVITGYNQSLWLTGRGVCCCPINPFARVPNYEVPSIVWESAVGALGARGAKLEMNVKEANQMRVQIGRLLVESVNHPDRYPVGAVGFAETQFLARTLARLVRTDKHPDNHPVTKIAGLDAAIATKIAKTAPKVSRGRLLKMQPAEQMDRFGLDQKEVVKLRRALIGLEGEAPDPRKRWDRPSVGPLHSDRA